MKFSDIKKFPFSSYTVNVSWNYIRAWIETHNTNPDFIRIEMDPFFQRGYVWTVPQKTSYLEYQLKGGFSGRDIFWNCPTWMNFSDSNNVLQLVDGKQRLNSVLEFLDNKIKVFGCFFSEFEDKIGLTDPNFIVHINNLKTERDVVEWYIGINTGGSIHTEDDLKPAMNYLNSK